MKRRTLLIAGAAATVGGVWLSMRIGPGLVGDWKRQWARWRLGPELGMLIEAVGDAAETGERLVALGADAAPLAERLRTLLALAANDIATPEQAQRILVAAISDDFASDRVILNDGWVLSETEATLARLRWLVAGKGAPKQAQPAGDLPAVIAEVESWGPRNAVEGMPLAGRSDDGYRLWFKSLDAPPWVVVRFDGRDLPTSVGSTTIASRIRDPEGSLTSKPGKHRIELFDPPTGRVQHVGDFEVLPRPEPFVHADGSASAVFCKLQAWGPQQTMAGEVRNPQRDGSMGLWIRTSCVPSDSAVFVGGVQLQTTILADRVAARVPPALLQSPATHAVHILHFGSNERLPVGELRVLPSE